MSKHNLDKDDRFDFIQRFLSGPFTLDEVEDFLKERIELDMPKVIAQAWREKSRQVVGSFKDGEGLRQIAAYDESADNEPRRMVYQVINSCMDPMIIDKQIRVMVKRRNGAEKLIRKAQKRLDQVADQSERFNFLDFEIPGLEAEK